MNKEVIKRLENNHFALNKAFERFKVSIEERNEKEVYASIGEVLLWVLTTQEWHMNHNGKYKSVRKGSEDGRILFGLIHAYNSMKHNMEFIKIHEVEGGFTFPISFPVIIPPITIHWISVKKVNEGYNNQVNNYKKYIEGKEVLETFNQAITFLNGMREKFI